MRSFCFTNLDLDEKKKIAKIHQKIYSFGKSSNSPRSFRFKRTRKINSTII